MGLCPLPISALGPHQVQTCVTTVHAVIVFVSSCMCQKVLPCLEGLVFLLFSPVLIIFPPLLQGSLNLEGREKLEISHLGLIALKSHSLQCPVVGLSIISHLVQEVASLMMAEETLINGCSRTPLEVILLLRSF